MPSRGSVYPTNLYEGGDLRGHLSEPELALKKCGLFGRMVCKQAEPTVGPSPCHSARCRYPPPLAVATENSVRSENKEVPIIREMMVATTMSSLFVALFALVASSFRTRAGLQAAHRLSPFRAGRPGFSCDVRAAVAPVVPLSSV